MQIHVKTGVSPDGLIVSKVSDDFDMRRSIQRKVLNTQDQQIRQALVDLGWTPPSTKQEGIGMKLVFEQWAAERGLNLDTYNGHYVSKVTSDFWECWQRAWDSK